MLGNMKVFQREDAKKPPVAAVLNAVLGEATACGMHGLTLLRVAFG
jgi:hypothetical protein